MRKITLREFLHIQQALTDEVEMTAENFPKPSRLCGRELPNNLDSLMFEQLCRLQTIRNVHALLLIPPEIILGLPAAKIMRTSARDAIGFALWVGTEIERINKLFQSTIVNPTKEEDCRWYRKAAFRSVRDGRLVRPAHAHSRSRSGHGFALASPVRMCSDRCTSS